MDYGICLSSVEDIVFLGVEQNRIKIKVGSGDYLFSVKG